MFVVARKFHFEIGEWYHCYSRGIDKRIVFQDERDLRRFLEILYLANDSSAFRRDEITERSRRELFSRPRSKPIVAVVAYALMPNHYHLILREIEEGGISLFMQKVGTAYTMYFNAKYDRVGNLFTRPFRARHLKDDRYMQYAICYVHLNPAEIFESGWKQGKVADIKGLLRNLLSYPYSSLPDFEVGSSRPEQTIINPEALSFVRPVSAKQLIADALEYYRNTDDDDLP